MVALKVVEQLDGRGGERKRLLRHLVELAYITGHVSHNLKLIEVQIYFCYAIFPILSSLFSQGWKLCVRKILVVAVLLLTCILLVLV